MLFGVVLWVSSAVATVYITNAGFETGTFDSWSGAVAGPDRVLAYASVSPPLSQGTPGTGAFFASLNVGRNTTGVPLTQNFTTATGAPHFLHFSYAWGGNNASTLRIYVVNPANGAVVMTSGFNGGYSIYGTSLVDKWASWYSNDFSVPIGTALQLQVFGSWGDGVDSILVRARQTISARLCFASRCHDSADH